MEATVRHRGGAGVSGYGGFAACRVTRSTSELSERSPHERSHDRSPGEAPEAAAPEVAALEKTLKQLQLQVPACNEACNPACRSPQPQPAAPRLPPASLRVCACVRWRTRRPGARPTVRSAACALVERGLLGAPQRGSAAARTGAPSAAGLPYALTKRARAPAPPIATKRLWPHRPRAQA